MASATLTSAARAALDALAGDLRRVFGNRLETVCAYGMTADPDDDIRTLALVDGLSFADLTACVPLARGWMARGLAVPLLLETDEFTRTLDVFPLEYGEIIASHVVIHGEDPFEHVSVPDADRRRACELQAKSHLIHLREGFLESGGDGRAVAALIGASAEGFRRLLLNIVSLVAPRTAQGASTAANDLPEAVELHLGVPTDLTRDVLVAAGSGPSSIVDPTALLARYIAAVEKLWELVDGWKRP